jgi:L-histidine N-alpha-methyltransferase
MTLTNESIPIEVHLRPDEWAALLRRDAAAGLSSTPKELSPTWLYDDRGCELFEQITRLPEYYPTRTEASILASRASEIATRTEADTLVELGSGTSEKTRLLLDALSARDTFARFVPFDVSEGALRAASASIGREYPGISVHAVVGDFERHLGRIPHDGTRLIAFLGSTIGNLDPKERAEFLSEIARGLGPDDSFLLGTDLVKPVDQLEAAYDDAAGVTAAFNRNVLAVLNRELGADFDLDQFTHVAEWVADEGWIEMRLRSLGEQRVRVRSLDLDVEFAIGEEMRTEISSKFRRDKVEEELAAAGLELTDWWTDPDEKFALSLSRPG